MIMMKVVLLSPAIFSGSDSLAEAAVADAEDEAVTRTTVDEREAVTTVVCVTEVGVALLLMDDSTSDDEGDGSTEGEANAAASEVSGCFSADVTVSTTVGVVAGSVSFDSSSCTMIVSA